MSENFLTQVWGLFVVGLISKEVEILLSSKNIKYYEYLGYEIPRYYNKRKKTMCEKRGTKIKVIVKFLTLLLSMV